MTTMILRNHCSETLRFPRSMSLRNELEQPMRCAIARNEMPEDSRSFRIWVPALRFESVTVLFRYLSAHSQLRISWFTVRTTLADCIFFCIWLLIEVLSYKSPGGSWQQPVGLSRFQVLWWRSIMTRVRRIQGTVVRPPRWRRNCHGRSRTDPWCGPG